MSNTKQHAHHTKQASNNNDVFSKAGQMKTIKYKKFVTTKELFEQLFSEYVWNG